MSAMSASTSNRREVGAVEYVDLTASDSLSERVQARRRRRQPLEVLHEVIDLVQPSQHERKRPKRPRHEGARPSPYAAPTPATIPAAPRAASHESCIAVPSEPIQEEPALPCEPVACPICLEEVPAVMAHCLVTCKHSLCQPCLREYLANRVAERGPLCCLLPDCKTDLTPAELALFLTPEEQEKADEMQREAAIPRNEAMFCPNRHCGKLLVGWEDGLDSQGAACPFCGTTVCPACKCKWHEDLAFPQYRALPPDMRAPEDQAVAMLGAKEGWKRCPGCKMMVQRTQGCDHMRCRCGKQFCYACGQSHCTCNGGRGSWAWNQHVPPQRRAQNNGARAAQQREPQQLVRIRRPDPRVRRCFACGQDGHEYMDVMCPLTRAMR